MNRDFPGFAEIYGGEDAGKWIDGKGRLYRLVGNKMIACDDTAQAVVVGKQLVAPGLHMTPDELDQLARDAGEDDEIVVGAVQKPASAEALAAEAAGEPMVARAGEPSVDYVAEDEAQIENILSQYEPAQIRELATLAVAESKTAGLVVLEGDDEQSVRHNASLLAQLTE